MSFIQQIFKDIDDSSENGRCVSLDDVTGLSGERLIKLLQCLARSSQNYGKGCYLEVGVFQGLTLTSVAAASSEQKCFGVDNFSQFDKSGQNRSIVERRLARHTSGNATLINEDFEKALLRLDEYIGDLDVSVFFVDGPHDYRSQYLSLEYSKRFLADQCVIVVDDSNYEHVRRANCDWLHANPDFALIFEAYTPCHPQNMPPAVEQEARAGWWNGVNVIVRDSAYSLARIYPPVDSSKERYLNDHLVHSSRNAEQVPQLLSALNGSIALFLPRLCKAYLGRKNKEPFRTLNTRSDQLKPERKAEFSNARNTC